MRFQEIIENVYQFNDYVNVYVIKNKEKAILVDFGSGDILKYLPEIGVYNIYYIFHTHYHRDQCFGDHHAIEKAIKIGGPKKESKLFENVEDFWKTKSFYDIYYFKPTFFVSTYNIPLDVKFTHGDTFNWGPYSLSIIKTSGHTTESISYLLTMGDKTIAFTGDLIHSGGKVITYYDLEYIYNDNGEGGIKRSLKSFKKLLSYNPDIILPSHGPAIYNAKEAIQQLTDKFEKARFTFCSEFSGIDVEFYDLKEREIKPVNITTDFPSIFHKGQCPPFIIKGHDHNCILIDYAGDDYHGYPLSELSNLLDSLKIDKIDFILPTHYHDDHTAGIPLLQERLNTKVFALEEMVDVLQNPTHYRLGCLTGKSIKIDRILKDGETFKWDNYEFTIYHFPGQTEYHMGLFGRVDEKNIFFVGDSLTQRSLVDRDTNLNCLNYCRIGKNAGFMKCADILLNCNPDYLAISHYGIIKVNSTLLKRFKQFVSDYESVLSDIIAQDNPNIGFDPNWISFKPIRMISAPGKTFSTNFLVRNYLDQDSNIKFEINLPAGWVSNPNKQELKIKKEVFQYIPISISIPENEDPHGRTIITADITWNDKKLGPFPDLMIDHGYQPKETWGAWDPSKNENLFIWILNIIKSAKKFFK